MYIYIKTMLTYVYIYTNYVYDIFYIYIYYMYYIYMYIIRTTTQVEAALAPLRDEGYLKPIFPKQWRFKVRQ